MDFTEVFPLHTPPRRTGLGDAVPGGDSNAAYTGDASDTGAATPAPATSDVTFWEFAAVALLIAHFLRY